MNLNFGKGHQFKPKPEKYCPFGRAVDKKLDELNYSKNQFAKEYGISPSYLSHLMRGNYPDSPQIPKIMKALEISKDALTDSEKDSA